MKTIKLVLITAIFVCSNLVLANNENFEIKKTNKESISSEIGKLLKSNNLILNEDTLAKVYFTINQENEIVVLSVVSNSEEVQSFIKQRLNYYKTSVKDVLIGKKYLIKIRIFA